MLSVRTFCGVGPKRKASAEQDHAPSLPLRPTAGRLTARLQEAADAKIFLAATRGCGAAINFKNLSQPRASSERYSWDKATHHNTFRVRDTTPLVSGEALRLC